MIDQLEANLSPLLYIVLSTSNTLISKYLCTVLIVDDNHHTAIILQRRIILLGMYHMYVTRARSQKPSPLAHSRHILTDRPQPHQESHYLFFSGPLYISVSIAAM